MTVHDIMLQNRGLPIGESIIPVCEALVGTTVFISIPKQSFELLQQGNKPAIQMRTGTDKYGGLWVYAWTTEERFNTSIRDLGIEDPYFVELRFVEVFDYVFRDSQYGGIILDSNRMESFMYPIPREMFGEVKKLLQE